MTENIYSVTDNKNVFRLGTKNNQIIIYQRLPSPDTTFLWAGQAPREPLGAEGPNGPRPNLSVSN